MASLREPRRPAPAPTPPVAGHRPVGRPVDRPAPGPHLLAPGAVVALQRLAGNRAVTSLIGEQRPVVQRDTVDAAKFRSDAVLINKGELSSRTNLKRVLATLDDFTRRPSLKALHAIDAAIRRLGKGAWKKYGGPLRSLQNRMAFYREDVRAGIEVDADAAAEAGLLLDDADWANDRLDHLLDAVIALGPGRRLDLIEGGVLKAVQGRKPDEARALVAALLIGNLEYHISHGGTDTSMASAVGQAILEDKLGGRIPEDKAGRSTANCWEFCMLAHALAGGVEAKDLVGLFGVEGWGTAKSWPAMGWNAKLPTSPDDGDPNVGDLVYLERGEMVAKGRLNREKRPQAPLISGETPGHVVLYVGGGSVVSHDGAGDNARRYILDAKWPPGEWIRWFAPPTWG